MFSDLDPPQSYTISGEGSGGVAGFAKGSAKVNLAEDGAGTLLNYAVQAHVGGKLAQIGSRLIDSVARKMAEQFFGRFVSVIAPEQPITAASGTAEVEAVESSPAAAEPPPAGGEAAPTSVEVHAGGARPETEAVTGEVWLPPVLWVTGLAAIIGAMLYFFTGRRVTR
jgi:hypothetical protein